MQDGRLPRNDYLNLEDAIDTTSSLCFPQQNDTIASTTTKEWCCVTHATPRSKKDEFWKEVVRKWKCKWIVGKLLQLSGTLSKHYFVWDESLPQLTFLKMFIICRRAIGWVVQSMCNYFLAMKHVDWVTMTPFEFKHFYSLKSSGLDASLKFRAHQCQARFFLKSCFVVETCFGETQETKGNAANTGKGVGKLPVLPFCWCFSNSWANDYFPFGKASFSGVQYNRGQVSVFTKNLFFRKPKVKNGLLSRLFSHVLVLH